MPNIPHGKFRILMPRNRAQQQLLPSMHDRASPDSKLCASQMSILQRTQTCKNLQWIHSGIPRFETRPVPRTESPSSPRQRASNRRRRSSRSNGSGKHRNSGRPPWQRAAPLATRRSWSRSMHCERQIKIALILVGRRRRNCMTKISYFFKIKT